MAMVALGLGLGFTLGVLFTLAVVRPAEAVAYKPASVLAAHGVRDCSRSTTSGVESPQRMLDCVTAPASPTPVHTPLRPHLYDYRGEQAALAYLRETAEAARQTAEHDAQVAAAEQARERAARAALPAPGPPQSSVAADGSVWDRLAQCESGGNWHINTGNGYYGGLQFSVRSWQWVGGSGYPHEHPRATQIAMGERLRARQGWGAWPSCSRRLGLR
jgi:hypothetical protein